MNLSCDNNLVFDENAGILCVNECVNDWWISSCDTNLVFDENAGILCVNECVNDWWISSCDNNLVLMRMLLYYALMNALTIDESLHVTLI